MPLGEWKQHRVGVHGVRDGSHAGWRVSRRRALARDGQRCQECQASRAVVDARGGQLEVHHVDGNWRNNSLVNLKTMCDQCHARKPKP